MAEDCSNKQRSVAETFMGYLRQNLPEVSPATFLKGAFAREVFGELPEYSNRHERGYQITGVSVATVSAFAICYSYDDNCGENIFVFVRKNNSDKLALLGGFLNLDGPTEEKPSPGEQPAECLIREISEETSDVNGDAVLNVSPDRLQLLYSGVDYCGYEQDLQSTHNTGYLIMLTPQEIEDIKSHASKYAQDSLYRSKARAANSYEIDNFFILTESKVRAMTADDFSHTNEFAALQSALEILINPRHNKLSLIRE